jgi:tetratricopeptide (TPR) repeat protein
MKQLLSFLALIFIVATGVACQDKTVDAPGVKPEGEQNLSNEVLDLQRENKKNAAGEDQLVEQAKKAFENRNLDEAIALFTKALPSSENPAELHYSIGLCYGHKLMLDDAIAEFKKAIAIEPNHIKARNNLGLAYERKGLIDPALAEYKQAVKINPDYPQTHYNIARLYLVRRRQNPELASLSADHYFRAGVLFLEQGNETGAITAYHGLKQTRVKEREQELYNKFTPELQKKVASK